ncbi:hypothetical protein Golob_013122 [Gossypium lobatum]|uniref:Uncharacterized protein n=1 Tax=Gossypium lobatum TaxID=34289 RepID=A0A7J8LNF9_9ROSI|nr:hypothetical protein [Gossypium lobatum]
MENKLVDLHIREEEEEVLRVEEIVGDHKPVYDLCLVGCFVTASVVHFPAMKLGHSDSFCPVRLQRDVDKLDLGWDISFWVSRRKATTMESIGLRKGNMEGRDPMIHDLEKSLIGDFKGKKSQRVGGCSEGVYESSNFTGKCDG